MNNMPGSQKFQIPAQSVYWRRNGDPRYGVNVEAVQAAAARTMSSRLLRIIVWTGKQQNVLDECLRVAIQLHALQSMVWTKVSLNWRDSIDFSQSDENFHNLMSQLETDPVT